MTLVHAQTANLLDSPPEESFDRLTRLAARLLGAPVALVTLAADDRVFFKSAVGLGEPWAGRRGTPLSYSFCRHVIASGAPLIVEDARRHPIVRSNPAIREMGWVAYAGVPLTTADGTTAGALCVIDALPRIWSPRDVALLEDLAASVVTEIEFRTAGPRLDPVQVAQMPPSPPADPAASVFDHAAVPMGLVELDGRWLRVNRALAELLGTSPAALAGCPAEASTHPADRGADREAMRLLLAGECASYGTEKRLLRDGEEPVWVVSTVTAVPDPDGGIGRFHVALQDVTDRKRAEFELRSREERYRLASRSTLDALWDWDLLTDRLVWDERAPGAFGHHRTAPGLSAGWWYERLHADDRERVVSGLHAAIARGDVEWTDEYRFRRADGSYAQVHDRAAIVRDEAGDAIRMVGAVLDTTDRSRADMLARGQSRLLEQIAAGLALDAVLERVVRFTESHGGDLTAAVMLLDPAERVLRLANGPSLPAELRAALDEVAIEPGAGLSATVALRREQVLVADLATDEVADRWRDGLVAHGIKAAWGMPLFASDGMLLGVLEVHAREARPPGADDLQLMEVAGHLAEIAIERDRNQQAVARGTRLLEQVLDTLPIGVWVLERDGRIMFGNPAGREIWGGARYTGIDGFGEYRGWWADSGEPIAPHEWAAARAILKGETSLNEVVQIETFDGVQKTILNSAVPLRSLDGTIVGAMLVNQDITEQRAGQEALRRSEEQLRHAQKMEAVGQLAGGIAHDFNNLLTGILSYSELVLQELRQGDPIRADIEQIRHAGERAAALTRQLLALSRRQVLQPRVLSLNGSVTELDSMLRRMLGADVSLEVDLDPGLWHVLADPGQLEQVLVNLVVNARDALPRGGRVTITTANLQLQATNAARGNGVRAGDYVTLSVSDTGVGMDVPTQARIFDPFFTTKAAGKGTGLGLSTVYGIVEQSGGHIAVESAPGQGATFTIFLPRHTGPGTLMPVTTDRRSLPGGTETLLLVEDESAVRASARRLLERHGYTVIEARHGADALRIVEAGEQRIDLVVTDLVMPEMGGRELVERLRARHPALKVLYMSGYSERAVTVDGVMPPATGFVEKPFTLEQLTRRTREILDGI
ncbi:MAG TPA: PAS domain S-box protein [Gemmatimonadales bacterium]|nr:PAS domain S-box protein [Gemmatimonadales bacterium]